MPAVILNRDETHLGYIDLSQKELRQPQLHQLASDPGSPVNGQILYRTDTHKIRARINGAWQDMATVADISAGGISASIVDVKGDLIVASAADTVIRLAAGANTFTLHANSATGSGLEWRANVAADNAFAATDRLLGRDTAGAGTGEEISVGGGIEFTGSGGIQTSAFTGDVTKAAGGTVTAIGAGVIVDADVNASAAIAATKLGFSPTGNIAATNVQAAIAEVESDLTALISSQIEGFAWKVPVRAASTANLTLTAPGATIDGVTMAAGDRFLAKDQTSHQQDGIYIWNGAASTATRATDMNVAAEANNATVLVEAGTANAGDVWTQTATIVTLDTTVMVWAKSGEGNSIYLADGTTITLTGSTFSVTTAGITATQLAASVAGAGLVGGAGTPLAVGAGAGISVAADAVALDTAIAVRKAAGSLTGGSNSEVITHNLNSRDVKLMVRNNATPWDEVEVYNEATTVNTCTLYAATGTNLPASYRWLAVG